MVNGSGYRLEIQELVPNPHEKRVRLLGLFTGQLEHQRKRNLTMVYPPELMEY